MKIRILIILSILSTLQVLSQSLLKGKVIDANTNTGIHNALISCNSFTGFTNENGYFEIPYSSSTPTLTCKHLSYVNKNLTISNIKEFITIILVKKDLRLDEVQLIGKKRKNSEILLKEEAINNVQAFTALEVLEQLPGQSVSEFSINSYKNIVFRTADIIERTASNLSNQESLANKSFGTAVVINDIPISNNENMQSWSPNTSQIFGGLNQFGVSNDDSTGTRYSNAGFGVDLREITTENIEEIEVVQGIPEAKYGDLTSGLIKVKTKAGVTPYISSISFRDGTTQLNALKGFKINDKLGFMNIGLSYLNAKDDPKDVLNQYKRFNITADWSVFKKNIKNTFSLNYTTSLDDGTQDPDDITEVFIKNDNKSITLTNRFNYNFIDSWINTLSLNTNFNYKTQHTLRQERVNLGGSIVPVSLVSGIYEGVYTPVTYLATREIEGKPINAFVDIQLQKKVTTNNNWKHQFTLGTSVRYSDNIGAGRIGNPETADDQFTLSSSNNQSIGFRPYSFIDNVQTELQFATYLQDNISKYWNRQHINIAAGIRWDNQNSYNVISPRINLSYKNKNLKLRAGFGIGSKAPSLNSTYTGLQYFDNIIGDFRTNTYNVAYVQTFVQEEQTLNLKPTISYNTEVGADYNFKVFDLSVTAFHKKLTDGLTNLRVYNNVIGDTYEILNNDPNAPTIAITGSENYLFENYNTINGLTSTDYGAEFILNIPKIEALNLDISINGMYTTTKTNDISNIYTNSSIESEDASIGVFSNSYTLVNKLFRLGSLINYHIQKVGLFLNFKTEHFLINEVFYSDDFEQYPIAYLDQQYNYVSIPEADRTNEQLYGHLFRNPLTASSKANVSHNIHMRVSKDFTNGFRIDFYANNFLNFKPTFIDEDGNLASRNITSLSFGMKLNYKF